MADCSGQCGDVVNDPGLTPWQIALQYLPESDIAPLSLVHERILQNRAQLWLGDGCAGVTEVSDDNRLHIWTAGGSMKGLLDMLESVEWTALLTGCKGVFLGGRKGWRRVFAKYGYAFDGEDMVKLF
jgi:hypothetical protein